MSLPSVHLILRSILELTILSLPPRLAGVTLAAGSVLLSSLMADDPLQVVPESATHFEDAVRPVLVQFCGDCHTQADDEHNFAFLQADSVDDLESARGLWQSVAEQLRNRTMPPPDKPQPAEEDRLRLAEWIDATLRATACRGGEFAGPVTTRRLNRYEYERTIRDLLGVEYKASETFPTDSSGGEGFNNNGETLFLPPLLLERYLSVAGEVLDTAVISPPISIAVPAPQLTPPLESSEAASRSVPPGQGVSSAVTIYVSGDYIAKAQTVRDPDAQAEWSLLVDGIAAETWSTEPAATPGTQGDDLHETKLHLARGTHELTVKNVGSAAARILQLSLESEARTPKPEEVERHRRLLQSDPGAKPDDPRGAARGLLEVFARQAYRRPVAAVEIDRLLALYDRAAERGDPYEESVKLALKGVLVSPNFLFRIETDPQSPELEPLGQHELAVRLSYFLWSTQPDEELLLLAEEGRLTDADELRRQVERMLDDPRSAAFAEQFIGQWLGTHEVGARVAPSTDTFEGQFTTELLLDLHDEPVYFFQHLLAEDESLMRLLDSDYAIVNRRLAEHYGLAGEGITPKNPKNPWTPAPKRGSGGPFEKVVLPDDRRGGVLGMGAVHMLTSYPDRTSPVLRGGWVLETLLDVRVPSPPPDVPQLKRGKKSKQSLREQLAQHRENPTCAACHNLMDPLGFALENFDVLGRWRDKDGEADIDAAAALPSGEEFSGPDGLRDVLLTRRADFRRQAARKLLGYALGRSLEDADECTVEKVSAAAEQQDDRVRALVHAVVQSTPFRFKQLPREAGETQAGPSRKPGFIDARLKERVERDRK